MSFKRRHGRHAVLIGLLLLTGLGLFLPSWRTGLGGLLPVAQALHEFGGILYGLAIVGWSARVFPWPQRPRQSPPYTRWAYFFVIMLSVTGTGLLVGPSWTHAVATVGHAAFAVLLVAWVGWHLATNRPAPARPSARINRGRRQFLKWLAGAMATIPALAATPAMIRLVAGRVWGRSSGTTGGALPGFVPYTVVNGYPHLALDTWRMRLEGIASPPRQWTWSEWQHEPQQTVRVNFRCVTGWAVAGVEFAGVNLADWLTRQGWEPGRQPWVTFYSADGVYTESLSAAQIQQYAPLLATHIDGQPLPVSQGFPLRLVVPGMYGYKSIKWLTRVAVGPHAPLGYWEARGYPQNAYIGSYF
ncbi:MAG: molybdopterin-dependent oxidoreductase [Thermaerobacter sp.]|nr:molybdopterin-dependent oxidoreductase [Thermaerobacter sp.]